MSVCKNVIAANNKKGWVNPAPTIRHSRTPSGKVMARYHNVGITDAEGNVVAVLAATTDGLPIIKCGAKVGLVTLFPPVDLETEKES